MKMNLLLHPLYATCLLGFPRPAFGAADESKKPYDPSGVPLHGNPNPGEGTANAATDKRDETTLADRALKVSAPVTGIGGSDAEIVGLLNRAEEVRDGSEMPLHELVALRASLQRFRGQSDAHAKRVDEETNRLEAILLGLEVKPGKKASITGQKRNLAH